MKRFNNRKILESKNKVVIKQVINFPSKAEMKKLVKAAVDDRTKQMINEAKKRFYDLEKDFAREKRSLEEAARFVVQWKEETRIFLFRALSSAESEISTYRKKQSMHEKNAERSKKQARVLEDDLKKERDVLESVRKSAEVQRKECKKISDEVRETEGLFFSFFKQAYSKY